MYSPSTRPSFRSVSEASSLSFLKLLWQVLEHVSFFVLWPFVYSCLFHHLVQFRFPSWRSLCSFCSKYLFLFHNGSHGINFGRDLCSFGHLFMPFGHGTFQHRTFLFHSRHSLPLGRGTRGRNRNAVHRLWVERGRDFQRSQWTTFIRVSIDVIINKGQEFRSTSHFPSFHLLVHVHNPAPVVNMHDLGVCIHPKGLEIAYAIAMFTASWYVAILYSLVSLLDLTVLAPRTTVRSTALRTGHSFRSPIPCPSLILLAGDCAFGNPLMIVEKSSTDPVTVFRNSFQVPFATKRSHNISLFLFGINQHITYIIVVLNELIVPVIAKCVSSRASPVPSLTAVLSCTVENIYACDLPQWLHVFCFVQLFQAQIRFHLQIHIQKHMHIHVSVRVRLCPCVGVACVEKVEYRYWRDTLGEWSERQNRTISQLVPSNDSLRITGA